MLRLSAWLASIHPSSPTFLLSIHSAHPPPAPILPNKVLVFVAFLVGPQHSWKYHEISTGVTRDKSIDTFSGPLLQVSYGTSDWNIVQKKQKGFLISLKSSSNDSWDVYLLEWCMYTVYLHIIYIYIHLRCSLLFLRRMVQVLSKKNCLKCCEHKCKT